MITITAVRFCLSDFRASPSQTMSIDDTPAKTSADQSIHQPINTYAVPYLLSASGANYKKILRLSYDVIITYDNRKIFL